MVMAAMNMVSAGGFSGVSFPLRRCPQGVASVLCKKHNCIELWWLKKDEWLTWWVTSNKNKLMKGTMKSLDDGWLLSSAAIGCVKRAQKLSFESEHQRTQINLQQAAHHCKSTMVSMLHRRHVLRSIQWPCWLTKRGRLVHPSEQSQTWRGWQSPPLPRPPSSSWAVGSTRRRPSPNWTACAPDTACSCTGCCSKTRLRTLAYTEKEKAFIDHLRVEVFSKPAMRKTRLRTRQWSILLVNLFCDNLRPSSLFSAVQFTFVLSSKLAICLALVSYNPQAIISNW